MAVTTRIFRTNRTQAVRLPKDVAFPEGVEDVEVLVVGEARLIAPKGRRWVGYFADGPFAEADFLAERAQPGRQVREAKRCRTPAVGVLDQAASAGRTTRRF
jgi:antitoxin VapB